MSRILIPANGRWYDELRAVHYYGESELERWVEQHSISLFPDYFVFPFKKDVISKVTGIKKRPDLALIRRDFSGWAVVEVEVQDHEIDHVLDQTKVFAEGEYNPLEVAEYAKEKLKSFCRKTVGLQRLTDLFSRHPPLVLVIADADPSDWKKKLNRLGVALCVFEVYKNPFGQYAYRASGEYPTVPAKEAHCRPHGSIPNLREVVGDFPFKKFGKGGTVEVAYDGGLTRWDLLKQAGRQYLRFVGKSNPLSPNEPYTLFRDRSHKYYFRRS